MTEEARLRSAYADQPAYPAPVPAPAPYAAPQTYPPPAPSAVSFHRHEIIYIFEQFAFY